MSSKSLLGKRAQAATEYLHTYGWVFLVIIAAGGFLAYYNYSHADNFVPQGCFFLSGIECLDVLVEDDLVSVVILNGLGFAISDMSMSMYGTCDSAANHSEGNPYSNPSVMLELQQYMVVFECQNLSGLDAEETLRLDFVNVETGESHTKFGSFKYSPDG